jgi:uncharacterized protein YjbI with pentapeptide repeats
MKIAAQNNFDTLSSNRYEIIQNETLKDCHLKDLTISGSLLSLNNFYGVTFENCVFFGTQIEKSFFKECEFINCSFQFSSIKECHIAGTVFQNCHWDTTHIQNTMFKSSFLDAKTLFFASKDNNLFENCSSQVAFAHNERIAA